MFAPDGEVRGGTLAALVERLTYHYAAGMLSLLILAQSFEKCAIDANQNTDTAFNEAFLITFKSFTTPAELLDQLVARFEKPPPEGLSPEEMIDWKRNWQDPVRGR